MESDNDNLIKAKHHAQNELCTNRPAYRQGRKLTAVKVYTINSESPHLFVYGVPKINLRSELRNLLRKYGEIKKLHVVLDHETEIFTECYHVYYEKIQSARMAKRMLDTKSFYGGVLHICYAPEYESMEDTKVKLLQRNKDVLRRLTSESNSDDKNLTFKEQTFSRKRKRPAIEITDERLKNLDQSSVWEGIPEEIDPRIPSRKVQKMSEPIKHFQLPSTVVYGPQLPEFPQPEVEYPQPELEFPQPGVLESSQDFKVLNESDFTIVQNLVHVEKKIVFRNKRYS